MKHEDVKDFIHFPETLFSGQKNPNSTVCIQNELDLNFIEQIHFKNIFGKYFYVVFDLA